jgi:hypothetical protein
MYAPRALRLFGFGLYDRDLLTLYVAYAPLLGAVTWRRWNIYSISQRTSSRPAVCE